MIFKKVYYRHINLSPRDKRMSVVESCFLYKKGRWIQGEDRHYRALVEYLTRQSTHPMEPFYRIVVLLSDGQEYVAWFATEEGRVFFIDNDAETTDDIVWITLRYE